MKFSEMNNHQLEATKLVINTLNEYIGGNENTLSDYEEISEEYINAYNFLNQPQAQMVEYIYNIVMVDGNSRKYQKHINFAGTDFIKERIQKRLIKMGY